MFKKYILFTIIILTLIGCGFVRLQKNEFNEPTLNEKIKYNFTEIPNKDDFQRIDTNSFYVQIFEGRYYNETEKENPQIIVFHNDGFFKKESLLYFGKFDKHRTKKSIYYGGRFRIKENIIEFEEFYPSSGEKTNYYKRNISKAKIEGLKIIFENKNSLITIFEKKQKLK
jgi:hypothetical protein